MEHLCRPPYLQSALQELNRTARARESERACPSALRHTDCVRRSWRETWCLVVFTRVKIDIQA